MVFEVPGNWEGDVEGVAFTGGRRREGGTKGSEKRKERGVEGGFERGVAGWVRSRW
jgi:hypothetical protein